VDLITPDWLAPPHVRAAMTTRGGGVSRERYHSLNLGVSGDDPAHVAENRRRLREALALPAEPRWLKQVHGATVVRLERDGVAAMGRSHRRDDHKDASIVGAAHGRDGPPADPPEADASWTTDPGVVCVVQAADCLPVLLCDDAGTVVAAAHAGWRGLVAGVLEATVRELPVKPAALMAWLGAAIGPHSFEVGAEVRDAFVTADPAAAAAFVPRAEPGKFLADLYALARQRLGRAGVTRVAGGGRDTLRERTHFFSYRRDGRCGRMAALVWLSR
jgi:polyphenol oxidase